MILTLALCIGASALTTGWHHLVHRNQRIHGHQDLCNHQWTEAIEVARGPAFGITAGVHFFKRFCPACGAQMDANADGTPYVPRKDRRDET